MLLSDFSIWGLEESGPIGGLMAVVLKLFYFQREVGCPTAELGVKRSRRFHALTSLAELLLQYPALHSFA